MSDKRLLLRVFLHEPRYHGQHEWPPSPARLFQALVAGSSNALDDPPVQAALGWLETQPPPLIGAPRHRRGQQVTLFVPNNDLDTRGGDPAEAQHLRVAKKVHPRLLDPGVPFLYAWTLAGPHNAAEGILPLAAGLYQLGRGCDMAWATAEIVDENAFASILADYPGTLHRPTPGAGDADRALACPCAGSLDTLRVRYQAQLDRFQPDPSARRGGRLFVQPPKPLFTQVAYGSAPDRFLFELRPPGDMTRFVALPLESAHPITIALRDAAVARLTDAGLDPERIDATLVGRRPQEPARLPQRLRVRIIPLPSIGHDHADPRIRRVLIEVPQGAPLSSKDVRWAFSGLVIEGVELLDAADTRMLRRYLTPARRWQTVTPAALPADRRRIDPARKAEESKDGAEREAEEARARDAVRQALRHAGIRARAMAIDVQREPLQPHGERAERFAAQPRFPKERLWHVAIELDRAVAGPLLLGDGRYLGLGLMAPEGALAPQQSTEKDRTAASPAIAFAWNITAGLTRGASPQLVAKSLRRAVISLAQEQWGPREKLPPSIAGHSPDGAPARDHHHLCFGFDPIRQRLFVIVPGGNPDSRLAAALEALSVLRAGAAGLLKLEPVLIRADDPLVAPSRRWRSITPYRVERHARRTDAHGLVESDIRRSCRRFEVPEPRSITVTAVRSLPRVGVEADVEVELAVAHQGPLLLGRSRHLGGGLFEGVDSQD